MGGIFKRIHGEEMIDMARLKRNAVEQRLEGQKHDQGKPRFSLLPLDALWQVVAVLEFGASKYGADNWRNVPNARERYFNACHRHLSLWWAGESLDDESGLSHLAHAVCCLLFLMVGDE